MITIDGGTGAVLHNGTSINSGNVIQVVNTLKTDAFTTTNTSHDSTPKGVAVTGFTASITPTSATSKILVRATFGMTNTNSGYYTYAFLYRDSTFLGGTTTNSQAGGLGLQSHSIERLDTPNTTSSITYSIRMACEGNTGKIGEGAGGTEDDRVDDSTLTLMEIAA